MNGQIPDHPVIRNMERTGYPDGKIPPHPICPICERECDKVYKNRDYGVLGCEWCIDEVTAWGEPECFPEKE